MNGFDRRAAGSARAWIAGATGIAWLLWIVGVWIDPDRACFAYLTAWIYFVTIVLGALCLVMIAHVSHARWFVVVRRLAETVAIAMPLLALLFLPVLFGVGHIYPWVPPLSGLEPEVREVILKKQSYLNVPFFVVRSVVYLAIWSGLAMVLQRWSLRQDRDPRRASSAVAVRVSAAGLVALGYTVTFAAIDWIMSLEPAWQSSVFGVYVFAGGMVGALGLMAILVQAGMRRRAFHAPIGPSHVHAIGRLLLTFVVFWAYIAYAQGFLIWIADLPEEAAFYLDRVGGGWTIVFAILILGHFGVPFLLLLSRSLKRSASRLALVGAWLLLMHYVDVFWLILPALGPGRSFHWLDPPALVGIGGAAVLVALRSVEGQAWVPVADPRLEASMEYESP